MYNQLSTSMTKLHEEGNAQTKFVQELSLKMLEQSKSLGAKLDVNVGQTALERGLSEVAGAIKDVTHSKEN
jgi:hypothetical protein